MQTKWTQPQAYELLKQYNQDAFHLRHGRTVEEVMRCFARELGYGEEEDFWGIVGLLHDLDFEQYPEEHCIKSQQLMSAGRAGAGNHPRDRQPCLWTVLRHPAGASDGKGAVCNRRADRIDLGGGLMRISKSTKDMELKSLKKKFKDKRFAAGCSRKTIRQRRCCGWELDQLLEETLKAMQQSEDAVR